MAEGSKGKAWVLEQLGGDRRIITLTEWSAPFGRPRDKAVARTPIRIRAERVYYPGSDEPTRHIFGKEFPNMELTGRFRDRDLGAGGALLKRAELIAFVADAQQIAISWGDVLRRRGFIVEFDPGIEAEKEIEWKLDVEIDGDEETPLADRQLAGFAPASAPRDLSAQLEAAFASMRTAVEVPVLPGSILDLLSDLLRPISDVVGRYASLATAVSEFKSATFAELGRFSAMTREIRIATIAFRDSYASLPADAATLGRNADESIAFLTARIDAEDAVSRALDAIAETERAATRARIGRIKTTFVARDGDTWEGISAAIYFDPGRANDVRDANGLPPGAVPTPGTEYIIPT